MVTETEYSRRIRIFTVVYLAAAVIGIAVLVYMIATVLGMNSVITPEYHYHGNGAVSGWATIFSVLGYMGGWMGKAFLLLYAMLLGLGTLYWIVGLIMNMILRKKASQGVRADALGTVMGVWTIIPGVMSAGSLIAGLVKKALDVKSVTALTLISVLFIGGSIYLFVTVSSKDDGYGWQQERSL